MLLKQCCRKYLSVATRLKPEKNTFSCRSYLSVAIWLKPEKKILPPPKNGEWRFDSWNPDLEAIAPGQSQCCHGNAIQHILVMLLQPKLVMQYIYILVILLQHMY